MLEGNIIAIEFDGCVRSSLNTPVPDVFDAIYHAIQEGHRIVILVNDEKQIKPTEDWLIEHEHPLLVAIVSKSVVVTTIFPSASYYISKHAVRFTDWQDLERYFIGRRIERLDPGAHWKKNSQSAGPIDPNDGVGSREDY